jgi:hypothetical protein
MPRVFGIVVLWSILAGPAARAGEGPSPKVPELQVLANYVGTWDATIASKQAPFSKGQVTATWTLDGRFVEQTGSLTSADGSNTLKVTTLMTYDTNKKAYRLWSFMSNGQVGEAEARWDPKTRTMIEIYHDGPITTTTTSTFPKDGVEKWKMVVTDPSQKVLNVLTGTNTRRSP